MLRVVIHPSAEAASLGLADFLVRTLRAWPEIVLGLPTGRTPIPLYRELVRLHRQGRADFSRATTFNLDEFAGLGPRDPRSYHAFMRRHLFDEVNIAPERIEFLNGGARDLGREARRYERRLSAVGGLDLVLLGIGGNGHLGFNEPAAALAPRTHLATLRPATRRANAWIFDGNVRRVPRRALSMGIGTILSARGVVLLATGRAKAAIVRRALTGPVTTRVPASLLQLHPNVVVVLDRDAGREL
ncbi:MAG TPA: glucosamine-6-phosphate deaminase [Vicinamibacterales bacterium]|nr:glucosamine-6-phosphate deaminase [Vicinamibacterales bacterium]